MRAVDKTRQVIDLIFLYTVLDNCDSDLAEVTFAWMFCSPHFFLSELAFRNNIHRAAPISWILVIKMNPPKGHFYGVKTEVQMK